MKERVYLEVAGRRYENWTELTYAASAEEPVSELDVIATPRPDRSTPFHEIGQPARAITVDERGREATLITGFVTRQQISGDSEGRSVDFAIASKTVDMAETAYVGPRQFLNRDALSVARELARPFGIEVTLEAGVTLPTLQNVTVDMGISPLQGIYKFLRASGLSAKVDPDGNLQLVTSDSAPNVGAIIDDDAVLSYSVSMTTEKMFSRVAAIGQNATELTDASGSSVGAGSEATGQLVRYRPALFFPRTENTAANNQAEATWLHQNMTGKIETFELTVTGWRTTNGELYAPNTAIDVQVASAGVRDVMVVEEVELAQNADNGTTATLTLRRRRTRSTNKNNTGRRRAVRTATAPTEEFQLDGDFIVLRNGTAT